MSEPREWWVGQVASKAMGIWEAWDTPPQQDTEDYYTHVRPVDEYDRIWRPEDADYRLPTEDDASPSGGVLCWIRFGTKHDWCKMEWHLVTIKHTWRRMPRGPENE